MKKIYPVFIPHLSCKNECVFCNQRKISGRDFIITPSMLKQELKKIDTANLELAFYGGSFTGLEKEQMIEYLEVANFFKTTVKLSTRPDYISCEILKILKSYNCSTIELGVQSLSNDVLTASKRGHTAESVETASKLIKDAKINLVLQMMVGLPKDSKIKAYRTAVKIAKIKPQGVRIYPTLVIEDTELMEMYKEGIYKPLSLKAAIDICASLVKYFHKKNIKILRVGLHNDVSLRECNFIGPHHCAFGELVENKIYLDKIIKTRYKSVKIFCPKGEVSKVIGHKKNNIVSALRDHQINIVSVEEDEKIKKYTLLITEA